MGTVNYFALSYPNHQKSFAAGLIPLPTLSSSILKLSHRSFEKSRELLKPYPEHPNLGSIWA